MTDTAKPRRKKIAGAAKHVQSRLAIPGHTLPDLNSVIMPWHQHHVTLPAFPRGFHLITRHVLEAVPEIKEVRVGLLHVFIQHTSASITINENADPDVRVDLESAFNAIVPEDFPYVHTIEGPDDMPAHVKAAMLGSSVTIPIENGRLALGTWQGIYLCEHRNAGGRRRLVVTVMGESDKTPEQASGGRQPR